MSKTSLSGRYGGTPSVGIVTRTKDRTVLLEGALTSISNQTYPHSKLVVVNDGGDRAPVDALVAKTFAGDSRVTVLHQDTTKGMEAASNAGIAALATDPAAIHNDDYSWEPDTLSVYIRTLVERNAQFPSVRGIVSNIRSASETRKQSLEG